MRSGRAISSGTRPLVIVMAIGAINDAAFVEGIDKAWNIRILARGYNRVVGRIRWIKLQSRVGLRKQSGNQRFTSINTVPVATKTYFVEVGYRINDIPIDINSCNSVLRSGRRRCCSG